MLTTYIWGALVTVAFAALIWGLHSLRPYCARAEEIVESYNVPHFHVDRRPNRDDNIYWKHRKSGGLYTVIHDNATREDDLTSVVVYRAMSDGRTWVRPSAEFFDGRFEMIELDD